MEEKKEPEEKPVEPGNEGEKPSPNPSNDELMLKRIEEATRKLEEENKRFERNNLLKAAEEANAALDGTSNAGGDLDNKKLSDKEYAAKVLKGDLP